MIADFRRMKQGKVDMAGKHSRHRYSYSFPENPRETFESVMCLRSTGMPTMHCLSHYTGVQLFLTLFGNQ